MDKPFAFSLREFNAVRQKIRALTGINLADSKDNMVYSRLARRLRALNLDTFQAYLRYLDDHQAETEHNRSVSEVINYPLLSQRNQSQHRHAPPLIGPTEQTHRRDTPKSERLLDCRDSVQSIPAKSTG